MAVRPALSPACPRANVKPPLNSSRPLWSYRNACPEMSAPKIAASRPCSSDATRTPGIAATVKARYYVINYWSNRRFNPSGIVPKGTPVSYA